MAVAYDSAEAGTRTTAVTSITYQFVNVAGDAIFVGAGCHWSGQTVSSITYAGVGLTQLWNTTFATSFGNAGFYRAGPAIGANNVQISMTGLADVLTSGAISLSGVDQTTPVGVPATASGNSTAPTVTVTNVDAADMVVDCCSRGQAATSITVGANQTERFRCGADTVNGSVGSTQLGSNGAVMSWTFGSVVDWHIGAVAFKPITRRGAGRARRRPRWEVQIEGQVLVFPSAEEAYEWLSTKKNQGH